MIEDIIKDSQTINEVKRRSRWSVSRIKKYIQDNSINITHFTSNRGKTTRRITYQVKRICPVCKTDFTTSKQYTSTCCSKSCANTFFRSGKNHPNWNSQKSRHPTTYRNICFNKWGKACIICNENRVVDVHHIDGNRLNDVPENIVPLCPTHHKLIHTKKYSKDFKELVTQLMKRGTTA